MFAIARSAGFTRLRPFWVVPLPVSLSALLFFIAAVAAGGDGADWRGLTGAGVAFSSVVFALLLGSLTAVANCGSASIAASTGVKTSIRAFNTGQAAAVLLVSLLSVMYDLAAPNDAPSSAASSDYEPRPHAKALATHAAATFAASGVALLLTLFAFRTVLPSSRARAAEAEAAALLAEGEVALDEPLLGDAAEAEEAAGAAAEAPLDLPAGMDHYIGGLEEDGEGELMLGAKGDPEPASLHSLTEAGGAGPSEAQKAADLRLYKITIFLTFFGSLCTYPGIISMVQPAAGAHHIGGRLLVDLCNVVFGGSDFVGRIAAAYFPKCSARSLFIASVLRFALTPALLFCNIVPPSGHWAAPAALGGSDAGVIVLLALLAGSNGFIFSSCAAAGPGCADPSQRGAVATALVARLFAGNTAGTLMSVLLSFLLGRK